MKKNLFFLMTIFMVTITSVGLLSCGDNGSENDDEGISIVGTWIDGSKTMVLDRNGSYNMTNTSVPSIPQKRTGTYSYNPSQGLMTVNVVAVAGQNSAYQQTYIVQTLTAKTLVLLYIDGDVEGYYTRK